MYTPVLKNADKPFIDLTGSIGTAIGNAQEAYKVSQPTPKPTTKPEVKPTTTPKPTPMVPTTIDIVVADENIQIEKWNYSSETIGTFENVIRGSAYDGKSFILVDDFAESNTLRDVMAVLDRAGKSYRIKTIEE